MSRPKIGSVTAVAASGENGTRLIHRRTVSQAAADGRANPERDEDRQRHEGDAGEWR